MAQKTRTIHTDTAVGYADRNGVCLIILTPIPGTGDSLVVGTINHSMRDPAALVGPSYRPDYGRTYRGEPH